MQEASRWARAGSGDESARQELLRDHLGLVHHLARQISRGHLGDIELDELLSAGALGLTDAVDAFDAARGHAFSTFATPRIRGAILDELRRQDHVPRSVRRKTRSLRAATEELSRSGAPMKTEDLAAKVGVDLQTLWRWQSEVEGTVRVSLDDAPGNDDGEPSHAEMLGGATESGIEDEITHAQEVLALRDALEGLKEQERLVLSLYYHEDLKLHEIAMAMGVTESRVSQIRTKALAALRKRMAPIRDES
ncbi:MAG: sigma-70 family RNA polymerase sigma factor [Gemmatimonadaceae bacterium]